MGLSVQTFEAGPIQTNAYLVADEETKDALIIDAPQGVTDEIVNAAKAAGLRITQIVITHAHWDHIADAAALKEATGVPLVAHPLAVDRLANPGSAVMELPVTIPPVTPDGFLNDGDEVHLGGHIFQVLHLPGHDPAHIVLYSEVNRIFLGGDVVFPGGHGTTEVLGADQGVMNQSLARVATLPPDVTVYPGHGLTTTLGQEAWLQRMK